MSNLRNALYHPSKSTMKVIVEWFQFRNSQKNIDLAHASVIEESKMSITWQISETIT